jgi:hypothetical protein
LPSSKFHAEGSATEYLVCLEELKESILAERDAILRGEYVRADQIMDENEKIFRSMERIGLPDSGDLNARVIETFEAVIAAHEVNVSLMSRVMQDVMSEMSSLRAGKAAMEGYSARRGFPRPAFMDRLT